jgi:O-acetyl-ADP-ribose deacetylase (regulator of RNase III)
MTTDTGFTLILAAYEPRLFVAFHERFASLPGAQVVAAGFQSLPAFDCMVSAANSFGLMDGGVDAAITAFFGWELEARVQRQILDEYQGEQPVGTSMIVETGHPQHPYIAHTPTMRVPMDITRTDNVYAAMWAMLLAVRRHNRHVLARASAPGPGGGLESGAGGGLKPIRTVACPGLGTGTGHVPFREAARQMALAYEHFLSPPAALDWVVAGDRQQRIRYGGDFGFHVPPESDGHPDDRRGLVFNS